MKRILLLFGLFCSSVLVLQAQRTVTGTVTEADGTPMIGASILVKGTSTGTVTDLNGAYQIGVPAGAEVLIYSYTGFDPKEVPLGASSVMDIVLSEGITLETAVVTALGIERERKALTYAVEEVGGDALAQNRETNIINAIGGRVSGVQTTSSGGQAGSSARIIIRGNSSFLGNNQPLFVIDGIPVDNSQIFGGGQNGANGGGNGDSPLFFGGTTNRAVDIDPNNVETMTVLKGAAATALYGSRAANGVVLITTKSGSQGSKPKITFSSNYGFSNARLPELQTKYSQGLNGNYFNGSDPAQRISTSWGALIDTLRVDSDGNYDPNGSPVSVHDNAKDFFRQGSNLDNALSISGGTATSDYYLSYANRIEEGIVRNNDMDRHSLLAKFNTQLSDRLGVGAGITYTNTDITTVTEGNGRQSYMWTVYGAPVTYDLQGDNPQDYLNEDGTQRLYRTSRNNPYFTVDQNRLVSNVNRFLPNFNISYKIMDGLRLTNRFGADVYFDRRLYREVIGTIGTFPTGRVYEDNITNRQFNNDITLSYNRQINDFNLDVLVGNQINDRATDRIFTQGVNLAVPDFFDLSNAATITTSQSNSQQRLIGAYASATVGYKSFLYLTVTGRNDWSSTLPKDNRSYFYPSVSGSFVLTDAFASLQSSKVLSFLKVRAGYAQVGNDAPVYATQTDLYAQSSVGDGQRGNILFPYNGTNGFTISNVIGNPALKPEQTEEIEFGVEAYFFNSRVHLEGTYYDRKTNDQIFQAPVAGSSGAVSRLVNAGSMQNEGVEFLLEVTPVKTSFFQWDIGGTFTKNTNRVISLTEGVDNIRLGGFTNPGIYIVRDQGYGVIWGSQYARNDDGQVLIDSDPNSGTYGLPLRAAASLGVIGNTQPDWFAGIRSTFRFGNEKTGEFTLFGLLDIRQGGDILNLDNFYLNGYGTTKQSEDRTGENTFVYPNGVLADGSPNNIEVPYDENYWRINFGRAMEDLVEDGSFVRLREVTFGYSLPKSALSKTFMEELNISFTGRNLYLNAPNFTGADPESSLYGSANGQGFYNFITPGTVGYNVALNVTFQKSTSCSIKIMIMKHIKFLFILALGLSLVACDDYLDINTDPNQPESPGDLDLLLADMTATTAYNLVGGGNWSRYGAQWMQQIANNTTAPSNDTYRINTSDCNNEWAFYSYAGVLINAKKMIELGEEAGQEHHVGVAKVLMAHNYALLADWWGDIPFTDALQRENNGKPLFDDQSTVYDGIQLMLDEGIAALGKESPVSIGGGDLLLGGDPAAWIRFAYALKARYYLRLTDAPGADDQNLSNLALASLEKAMTSAGDEARFEYNSDPGQESPWNQWIVKFANTMQMSNFFVSKLQGLNDPRLPIMSDVNGVDAIYLGHSNGGAPTQTLAEISNIGAYYLDPDLDIPMMTYVEQLFIKAEAQWRTGQTTEAAATYETAIRTHMEQLSGNGEFETVISSTDIDAYLAANPLEGLGDLIEQKYIASFLLGAFEAYNDFRRTGFPDDIQPALNADYNQIPTRMIYTDTEVNNNAANVPANITLTSKVWWDGN